MFRNRVRITRTQAALSLIFAIALTLRAGWSLYADTVTPPLSDPQYYSATAENIADGFGYSVRVDQQSAPGDRWGFMAGAGSEATAFWSPGYPFAIAALYWLFGAHEVLAKALNVISGALTVFPVYHLGARIGIGRRAAPRASAGLLAASLMAIAPSHILWGASLFSEPLFTLGVAATFALALWSGERRTFAAYFVTGLLLAATAFVRAQGLVFIVPVVVLLVAPRLSDVPPDVRMADRLRAIASGSARVTAPVLIAMVLLIVPWAVRNQRAMGAPSIISGSGAYNLREAHAPYANGTSTVPTDLWDERPGISFHEREIFGLDVGTHRAITYAREHPGREMRLAVLRVGWLLRSDAEPSVRWSESLGATPIGRPHDALVLIGDMYWYGLLAVATLSLFVVRRDRLWLAAWSSIAMWVALHLVFFGEPRYHIPLLPVLTALAAAVVMRLVERTERGAPSN
jgi:hypothetical protein